MDGPDSTSDKTDGSFGGASDVASGDNHGIDSVQSLARAMSAEQQARRRTNKRLANLEFQWQLSAVSLSGLSALQDVIPMDRFVLGRALLHFINVVGPLLGRWRSLTWVLSHMR